ncbi:hypothetical protein KIN20_027156 [Parelaphostrongylus tenuis]|uniref:Uncharacterized protein n=1 Tax=Parelaphostrongylus tenuis TaxID=148309 RepID=A0AAD5QYY6_PARTN|nr:hypothetical protein KIN20_027156 [Parelaphostrongylus tenuis]
MTNQHSRGNAKVNARCELALQISSGRRKIQTPDGKLLRKLYRRLGLEQLMENTHVLIEAESPSRDG